MSVSRPARSLTSSLTKAKPAQQCRAFSSTPVAPERRRSRFASVKASEMGLVSSDRPKPTLNKYTKEEVKALANKYTPEQLRAIEAGEQAVNVDDIASHGVIRNDPYRLQYLDDLSKLRPVLDHKPKVESTVPANARWMNEEERIDQVNQWMGKAVEQQIQEGKPLSEINITKLDFRKFVEETTSWTGGGKRGSNVIAPKLPKIPELQGAFKSAADSDPRDPTGRYDKLIKQTGMDLDTILNLQVKMLVVHRVVNQTRLGKIQSMYCLAIAGNGNGLLGIGEGKSQEIEDAQEKAKYMAMRNMKPIPRYENRTIFGDIEGKCGAVEVELMARPPGFGLRVQHNIFEMAKAAGISDLAARVPHARNKMNTIKATYKALMNQRLPDEVARGLGKKLVDVRKVYYGGDQMVVRDQEEQRSSRQF